MKIPFTLFQVVALSGGSTHAFLATNNNHRRIVSTSTSTLHSSTETSDASASTAKSGVQSIGLLTFDLDDTLYPIDQIVNDANGTNLSLDLWEINVRQLQYQNDAIIPWCQQMITFFCVKTE